MARIFVVDDRPEIVKIVSDLLREEGHTVETDTDPLTAIQKIRTTSPDLVILDIRMKGMDGLALCKELKSNPKTRGLMIIMLTAKTDESDIILGLEMGADDYLGKPVRRGLLIARVNAVLRRRQIQKTDDVLTVGPLRVDRTKYQVFLDDAALELRPKEFELLAFLAAHEGQVITRNTLSEQVWGRDHISGSKTIEFHMHQLKKKLGKYGSWITALTGVGYRFEVDT